MDGSLDHASGKSEILVDPQVFPPKKERELVHISDWLEDCLGDKFDRKIFLVSFRFTIPQLS